MLYTDTVLTYSQRSRHMGKRTPALVRSVPLLIAFALPWAVCMSPQCPSTERAANRATSKHRGNGEAQGNGTNKHPTNIQKAQPHAGGNCRPRIGCWVRWSLCGWLWRWRLAADCGATLVAGFGAALAADCSAAFAAGFGAAFVNGFGGALAAEWGTAAAGDFALALFPPLCNAQACEVRYTGSLKGKIGARNDKRTMRAPRCGGRRGSAAVLLQQRLVILLRDAQLHGRLSLLWLRPELSVSVNRRNGSPERSTCTTCWHGREASRNTGQALF